MVGGGDTYEPDCGGLLRGRHPTANDRLALSRQVQEQRLQPAVEREPQRVSIDDDREPGRLCPCWLLALKLLARPDGGWAIHRGNLVEPSFDLEAGALLGLGREDEDVHVVGKQVAREGCEWERGKHHQQRRLPVCEETEGGETHRSRWRFGPCHP